MGVVVDKSDVFLNKWADVCVAAARHYGKQEVARRVDSTLSKEDQLKLTAALKEKYGLK